MKDHLIAISNYIIDYQTKYYNFGKVDASSIDSVAVDKISTIFSDMKKIEQSYPLIGEILKLEQFKIDMN